MQEGFRLVIGFVFLLIGYFVGNYLAHLTKEELKAGRGWFKLIIFVSLVSAIVSAVYRSDVLLFSFLFIAIVTSRSLKR